MPQFNCNRGILMESNIISYPKVKILLFLTTVIAALGLVVRQFPQTSGEHQQPPQFMPDEILTHLKQGNQRFVDGRREFRHLDKEHIAKTAKAQTPVAAILSCSDSRVPVEHIFDVGIGDLFVIRVAGNVCSDHEDASIDYAVNYLKTPLVVILGHTHCGAVTAVVEHGKLDGKISQIAEHIIPALHDAEADTAPALYDAEAYTACDHDGLIDTTVRFNVRTAMADLLKASPKLREQIALGSLKVIGAIYDLGTGRVEWLEPEAGAPAVAATSHR